MDPLIGWAAPIVASVMTTVLTTYLVAKINQKLADSERKRDEAKAETEAERRERAEWRARVEARLDEQDETIKAVLSAQCTQMRSDAIHRAHRYIDDLGCASIEEKQSFYAEWEEYQALCDKYGIENNFVNNLVQQVMTLPDRKCDL